MVSLAEAIKEARTRHGMSRDEFARMVPCSAVTVESIEKGYTRKPNPATREAIKMVLTKLENDDAAPPSTNGAQQSDQRGLESVTTPISSQATQPAASASRQRDSAGDLPPTSPSGAE